MTYKKRAAFMAAAVSASSLLLVPTAEAVENTSKTAAKAQPGVTVSEKASVESTGSRATQPGITAVEKKSQPGTTSPAVPVETPKDVQSQEAETAEAVESPVPVEEPAAVVPQAPVVEAESEVAVEPVSPTPAYTPEPAPQVEAAGVDTYEAAEPPQQQVVDYTPQAPAVDSWEPVQNTTPVTQETVVQAPQSQAESQITAFIGDVASNVQEAVQNLESGQSADTSDVDTVTPADS